MTESEKYVNLARAPSPEDPLEEILSEYDPDIVNIKKEEEKKTELVPKKGEVAKGLWGKLSNSIQLKKITNSIKTSLVSSTTENALLEFYEMWKLLTNDMDWGAVDVSLAIGVLTVYHKSINIKSCKHIADKKLVENLLHHMKFASCAYGWKLIYGYAYKKAVQGVIDGIKMNDQASIQALKEHCGIKAEDIIQTRWTSQDIYAPGHYVALDHSTKSIIVAIRGTFHLRDALTDVVAKYVPFKGGLAHSGMLTAAKQKQTELTPLLVDLIKKHQGYQLTIVGHSLGAGTAALLTILLSDEFTFPMHCYAFAAPCVVSHDLSVKCKELITTVVVNDDVVPRLSFGSLHDLKVTIKQILEQSNGKVQRLFQIMAAGNQLGDAATKKISNYLACSPHVKITAPSDPHDRLYPPGSVYYIYDSTDQKLNAKYDVMEESDPLHFKDIVVSNSMYIDHFPDCYELTLQRVLDKLNGNATLFGDLDQDLRSLKDDYSLEMAPKK